MDGSEWAEGSPRAEDLFAAPATPTPLVLLDQDLALMRTWGMKDAKPSD